jgi:hypothetical protein
MMDHPPNAKENAKAVSRNHSPAPLKPGKPTSPLLPTNTKGSGCSQQYAQTRQLQVQAQAQEEKAAFLREHLLSPMLAAFSTVQAAVVEAQALHGNGVASLSEQFNAFVNTDIQLRMSLTQILQEERSRSHTLEVELRSVLSQVSEARMGEQQANFAASCMEKEAEAGRAVAEALRGELERLRAAVAEKDEALRIAVEEKQAAVGRLEQALEEATRDAERLRCAAAQQHSSASGGAAAPLSGVSPTLAPVPSSSAQPPDEHQGPKNKRARLEAARQQFRTVTFADQQPLVASSFSSGGFGAAASSTPLLAAASGPTAGGPSIDSRASRLSELEELQQQLRKRCAPPQ